MVTLVPCIQCAQYVSAHSVAAHLIRSKAVCAQCAKTVSREPTVGDIIVHGVATRSDVATVKQLFHRLKKAVKTWNAQRSTLIAQIQSSLRDFINEQSHFAEEDRKAMQRSIDRHVSRMTSAFQDDRAPTLLQRFPHIPKHMYADESFISLLTSVVQLHTAKLRDLYNLAQVEYVLGPVPPKNAKLAAANITFHPVSGEQFYNAIMRAISGPLAKYKESLSVYSVDDYKKMDCYLSTDNTAGYCVTPDRGIVSVFSTGKVHGARIAAVQDALQRGGEAIDAFDEHTVELYTRLGFEICKPSKSDPQYATSGWSERTSRRSTVIPMRRRPPVIESFRLTDSDISKVAFRVMSKTAKLFHVETATGHFVLNGRLVRANGLYAMMHRQKRIKDHLVIGQSKTIKRGHLMMIYGPYAYDINSLRAIIADRYPGYVLADMYVQTPAIVAIRISQTGDRRAEVQMNINHFISAVMQIVKTHQRENKIIDHLLSILPAERMVARQTDLPDNVEDLSLKWERANIGGESFGSGAQTGIMAPSGDHPLASTDVLP